MKPVKLKTCKICGSEFRPQQTTQRVCGIRCAIELAEANTAKKLRKQTREAKARLKSRQEWLAEAQQSCNQYIRARDEGLPCVSCGRQHNGQHHASHYRSVGACSSLRFHPLNIWRSCAPCNNNLSGNIVEYRINLCQKLGADIVEWLESQPKAYSWTIEDAKEIRDWYKQLKKDLENV